MTKAQYLLQQNSLWTDGRRILAYDIGVRYTQDDRNNESVQLLKKIADMEIDDFPSYIIEEIKNTWENWNSLRLSIYSLHLDEI
ncbi:hypothetical protein Godav_010198 [Gossypium davidsonii]|uniref:Uncharacterized protein n=2 Tax=Gossypium TaxID=3633 RepID=A0A7J8SGK9_GOSDV|nr:hypothetical protein [Gossypium davidsonii]MBA0660475.1 hypothetical protein [Gossypium klotzschianum]